MCSCMLRGEVSVLVPSYAQHVPLKVIKWTVIGTTLTGASGAPLGRMDQWLKSGSGCFLCPLGLGLGRPVRVGSEPAISLQRT